MIDFINETFTLNFYLGYLLIGTVTSFLIESTIRWTGQEVSGRERLSMICSWPVMVIVFIYNFLKGLFNNN